MQDALGDRLRDAIGDGIDNAVGEHERGYVTKWVALIETVGPDGERGVWQFQSHGASAWDNLGLLDYAATRQRATIATAETDD